MGYKALITLDLPKATDKQRDDFYESLRTNKWYRIATLTTAWFVSFVDSVTRENAIKVLKGHLLEAKSQSKAPTVEFALQLDTNELLILKI